MTRSAGWAGAALMAIGSGGLPFAGVGEAAAGMNGTWTSGAAGMMGGGAGTTGTAGAGAQSRAMTDARPGQATGA